MTSAPDAAEGVAPAAIEVPEGAAEPVPDRPRPPRKVWIAVATALLAVLCGALLPFAPVAVNQATVSWPADPAKPESTMLTLTAYRPLDLDVRFSCDVARAAQGTADGVILSTAVPGSPEAGTTGMLVTASGDKVQVRALDRFLVDWTLPPGPCEFRITGHSAGLPSYTGPVGSAADPPVPDPDDFAGPDNAELEIRVDDIEVLRTAAEQLPDVDVLATSVPADAAAGLSVELRTDDEFTSSPTALKKALIALLVAALLATVTVLLWLDRSALRPRRERRVRPPRVVDGVVPAVLLLWILVAPESSDDGYFSAQARNAALSGEVGNYYNFYDQSFTPFTWLYQGLSWWQELVGLAPLEQRIPALVCGLLTWVLLRRFGSAAAAELGLTDRRAIVLHVALAITFLTWWLPQNMGVRPEAAVALCGIGTMHAVLVARQRNRLAAAWLACALAGAGFAAHTTGVSMFAPLIAGIPLLFPVIRVAGDRLFTALRALAVASGAMLAALLGFADGALRDFTRGQERFLSALPQQDWTDEFLRYEQLLGPSAGGAYLRRAAILACLLALIWFLVLEIGAHIRRRPLPATFRLAGWSIALSLPLFAFTTSKWTHHFGALAGIGPAFLGIILAVGVPLTFRVSFWAPIPIAVVGAAAVSFAGVLALAWHGPNSFASSWMEGVRDPNELPSIAGVTFDSPLLWLAAIGLVAACLAIRDRRGPVRVHVLRAVPLVVLFSLAATSAFAVGTFGVAAAQNQPRESVWARTFHDPSASDCGPAGVLHVLDPDTATVLPFASDIAGNTTTIDGFVEGSGYYLENAPQGSAANPVWGSVLERDGRLGEQNFGRMNTGWYDLPVDAGPRASVTTMAAGTLSDGNTLTAVYGRRVNGAVVSVGAQELTDLARAPSWRTFVLDPPVAAEVVRLEAVDSTVSAHGWVGFTAPATARAVLLRDLIPRSAPVALSWKNALSYPCQRQPSVVDGITEPPRYGVLVAEQRQNLEALYDFTWQLERGAVFGQVMRTQSVLQLATVGADDPRIQVYEFAAPYAPDAYTVRTERTSRWGASEDTG